MLFRNADTDNFEGTVTVRVTGGQVAATALEPGTTPGEFATLPVTPVERGQWSGSRRSKANRTKGWAPPPRARLGGGGRWLGQASIALAVLGGPPCLSVAAPTAAFTEEVALPLRCQEPPEQVALDLRSFIAERMSREPVPGLSIAQVRDGQIVWTEGFGAANSVTGRPVTRDTVFEVASISKVVTAYTALRLVDAGLLSLDRPVSPALRTPWLRPSEWGRRITVRHLAAHASGLSDNLFLNDKRVYFEPGSEFRYSGMGFLYLQYVIEETTGESLETAAKRLVFDPLGMSASSFVNREPVWRKMANGHLTAQLPTLIFLLPFLAGLGFLTIVFKLGVRIVRGRWKLSRRQIQVMAVIAGLSAVLFLCYVGYGLPHLVLISVLCGTGLTMSVAFLLCAAQRFRVLHRWARHATLINALLAALAGWALLFAASRVNIPIPTWPSPPPSAVESLRTTAGDLGRLLIELAEPRLLSADLAAQLRSPQIAIDGHFSWGLGIGIQHSAQGDALWQNGNTFGFQSVIVIYPSRRWGVVVLTNGHQGRQLAYDVAHRALGGEAYWRDF